MCASIQLALVGLLVMSSHHPFDMSWSGVLLISFFPFQKCLFWLDNTMYCLIITMRLFTIDCCGDYRQVWFSETSILVVSFGLHQWIQLVDRISMCLAQLAFCSDCQEVPRQRFLSTFSLFTIVSIAAEEPSVEHANVVLHTSCTDDWLRPVRACLSHSACWCLNVPLDSNLSRMSCILWTLDMWSMSEVPQMCVCIAPSV